MKLRNKLYAIALVIFALIFSIALTLFVVKLTQYQEAEHFYEEIQNQYIKSVETILPKITSEPKGEKTAEIEPTKESLPIIVDFEALFQENQDIVGWLYCEGTPINYPVVRSSDNNYYLKRDLSGQYLVSGTLFTDYRNGTVGKDRNYIIFGHNMKNGSMFGTLHKYKEQSYREEHPTLYYFTPQATYRIETYAGFVVSTSSIIYMVNPPEKEFRTFLEKAKEKSTFDSNTEIKDDDFVITFSTCSYEFDGARYILIGKLVIV